MVITELCAKLGGSQGRSLPCPSRLTSPFAGVRRLCAFTARRIWQKPHAAFLKRGGGKNPGFVARDDPSEAKRRENRALADFVTGMLRCCKCGMVTRDTRSWRAYLTDDEPPQAVVYCPACASREFDE